MTSTRNVSSAEDYLREAREILANFMDKRSDHEAHLLALGKERAALAYNAHRGDPKARKRLDILHSEHAKADSEFLSLDSAVVTAQSKIRDAEASVAKAEAAAKANKVLALLPVLKDHGKALDQAAAQVIERYLALHDAIVDIRSLTNGTATGEWAAPSEQMVRVSCRTALISALASTPLEVDAVRPDLRHSFQSLVDGWSTGVKA